jgi:hypothetical protein
VQGGRAHTVVRAVLPTRLGPEHGDSPIEAWRAMKSCFSLFRIINRHQF